MLLITCVESTWGLIQWWVGVREKIQKRARGRGWAVLLRSVWDILDVARGAVAGLVGVKLDCRLRHAYIQCRGFEGRVAAGPLAWLDRSSEQRVEIQCPLSPLLEM